MGKHHPPKYGGAFEALRFMAGLATGRTRTAGNHADIMPIRLRLINAAGQVAIVGIRRGVVTCHDEQGHALPFDRVAGADGERLMRLLESATGPAEAAHSAGLVMPDAQLIDAR